MNGKLILISEYYRIIDFSMINERVSEEVPRFMEQ